jgi:hypothetical protein
VLRGVLGRILLSRWLGSIGIVGIVRSCGFFEVFRFFLSCALLYTFGFFLLFLGKGFMKGGLVFGIQ